MSTIVHKAALFPADYEGYTDDKLTKVVRVDDLRVPIHIALGRFEAASQEELEDLITDLNHELNRRSS